MNLALRFFFDEDGATAIEYGVIAASIAVALIVAFTIFGDALGGLFGYVRDQSVNAINSNL